MTTQARQGQRFDLGSGAAHLWFRVLRAVGAAQGVSRGVASPAPSTAPHAATPALTAAALDDVVVASEMFAAAVRENSNLELDWLWLAGRVPSEAERRYCLQRALEINPARDGWYAATAPRG